MSVAVTTPAAARSSVHAPGSRDRLFYGTMSAVLALTVFAGFGPTYYLRLFSGGPQATVSGGPFSPIVHLHGALFTAWVLLFLVQTTLVAARRVAVHRRLGVAGAVLAFAMIVTGTLTAIGTARRGAAPVGVDPLAFLAIPLFDLALFSTFVTTALVMRRRKEAHKRLMLLAYVSIITAAVARLPLVSSQGPLVFFGLSFLFVVAAALYDLASRRQVHRVYLWGGALIFIFIPLRLAISGTAAWHSFAAFLIS